MSSKNEAERAPWSETQAQDLRSSSVIGENEDAGENLGMAFEEFQEAGDEFGNDSPIFDSYEEQGYDEHGDSNGNTEDSGRHTGTKRFILQKFTIYNSATTMYIVGSNARETLFRIIEITADTDLRNPPTILEIRSYFYTRNDMAGLLDGLNESIDGGIHKVAQAYGLLGFIKFTREYYLLVVTKCSQVAVLGGHYIYHIDETKLVPLNFKYRRPDKHSDEERLLSIFKYLDLGRTFYFSYTYDLTNSLQNTFLAQRRQAAKHSEAPMENGKSGVTASDHNERFIWNNLLLGPVLKQKEIETFEWFQPIIHGFIDQANISIYGRKIYITIIARRSHHYAGARFLKRGVNDKGNVANEVETEQIVSDMLTSSFHDPRYGFYANRRYTSFVQHRGSIPLYWTQDLNKLPKPPIEINLSDPFYQSSAMHFNNLFLRYGSPVVILNLIKTKEKQPRESKLNQHFESCIKYLNQFLPPEKKLQYHSFDMSKHSKKNLDVITPLQIIAKSAIEQTGFFHNGKDISSTKLQRGIIRTNCIDCLDRTNAAQFIIFKEALSHQLQSLGLISSATDLDYDSDLINILTEIFHDHGDTIAVQYGGSNLVNTMDSYRRINQWSSHTRDVLNSIKRIYSNSFMDSIRQEAINLFLGNYVYEPHKLKLWELQNDNFLHNGFSFPPFSGKPSYQHWYNSKFLEEIAVNQSEAPQEYYSEGYRKPEAMIDSADNWFNECYGQRKFESFRNLFQFNMNSNLRYFPSNLNSTPKNFDYSPFETRKPFFKKRFEKENLGGDHLVKDDSFEQNLHLNKYKQTQNEVRERSFLNITIGRSRSGTKTGGQQKSNVPKQTQDRQTEHNQNETEKEEEMNNTTVYEMLAFHEKKAIGESTVKGPDFDIYRAHFEPPRMPSLTPKAFCPDLNTSSVDSEIYHDSTTRIKPKDGSIESVFLKSADHILYEKYVKSWGSS